MIVKDIDSKDNPTFRKFLRLFKGQGVKKYGLMVLSGPKQVEEILRDFPERCEGIIVREKQAIPDPGLPGSIRAYRLGGDLFREMDLYGTGQPLLVVRVQPLPPWEPHLRPAGCTLFVLFQDPVNVGTVVRSAAAFGVSRLVVLKEAAHPFHHKSVRVAGSAIFRIPLFQGPSIKEMGKGKIPLITLSPEGRDIHTYKFPRTFGLLPGLEGPGLPADLKGTTPLAIPMAPGVESLNAALATGIALYVWRTQQRSFS